MRRTKRTSTREDASRNRRRYLTYGNVAATLALVLAMSGAAVAGTNYLITSTKQIKPSVLHKLTGKTGKTGKTGATGATGATGPTGPAGAPNPNAVTAQTAANATGLAGPLASGQTLRGTFGVAGDGPGFVEDDAITFPVPLSAAPTFNYVTTGSPTTNCPGSYAAPTAAAGELCLYGDFLTGATGMTTAASGSLNQFGAVVYPTGTATNVDYEVTGTWAVTAP